MSESAEGGNTKSGTHGTLIPFNIYKIVHCGPCVSGVCRQTADLGMHMRGLRDDCALLYQRFGDHFTEFQTVRTSTRGQGATHG